MASILVIDDHAAVLETVKVILAKQGHEIRTAPNGKAGMTGQPDEGDPFRPARPTDEERIKDERSQPADPADELAQHEAAIGRTARRRAQHRRNRPENRHRLELAPPGCFTFASPTLRMAE